MASSAPVLVTGGLGYIGSHTIVELLAAGHRVVVVDNLVNSSVRVLDRLGEVTGKRDAIAFEEVNIADEPKLDAVFEKHGPFSSVIHFAALKAVGESMANPLQYYSNNIAGTMTLLKVMEKYKCTRIVFSSSATVYGSSAPPLREDSQVGVGITNPYGWTKFMMEQILKDTAHAHSEASSTYEPWQVVLLRYFNPVGAHESGLIGEDPAGPPNNLMPFVLQVAVGRRPELTVFGDDYDTPDGTAVRDYIHVVDLANGHLAALEWVAKQDASVSCCEVFNLGTGKGSSVLEVVNAMKSAAGKDVPYKIGARRSGDLPAVWASTDKARDVLGWTAARTVEDMCADGWRWQSKNPWGYRTEEEAKRLG